MPDKWDQYATPADKWEQYAASGSPPPDLRSGAPGSAGERFLSGFTSAVNPIPGVLEMAGEAADPNIGLKGTIERHIFAPSAEQFNKSKQAFTGEPGSEFEGMSPAERISSGIGHGLAMVPLIGPAAANAGEQIGEGDVAGGLGSGAGLISSVAATPPVMRGLGRGLMAGAEPIAENALGIRNVDRAPNKTPGRAALDLTTGVRPESVSRSAGDVIGQISNQRNALISRSNAPVRLGPAFNTVQDAINTAQAGNSETGHLAPMREQLTDPRTGFQGRTIQPPAPMTPVQSQILGPNGQPLVTLVPGPQPPATISPVQSPADALAMRQRFGEDFTKFDTARPLSQEALRVGNRAYGALTDELHRAVPESAPLDRQISNLIPVRDAARAKELNAGVGQRMLGRFGAHTGALAGALYGGHEFGLPGALAGIAIPEMLANPTSQMIAARGLNATGRAIRSPLATRPAQLFQPKPQPPQ